ncbi:MAG: alpha/beta hydrolase family protein [Candidatus Helarchaeota archaeon]
MTGRRQWKVIILLPVCMFILGITTYGAYFLYRLDRPKIIKAIPDPFLFNNGTRVQTEAEWQARRLEIKEMLLDLEYGHMPFDPPDKISVKVLQSTALTGGHILNTTRLIITPNNSKPSVTINLTLWVYIPNATGPFPTIVKVGADGIGSQEAMSQKILERGYLYVCYNHTELDPDTNGFDIQGACQTVYPNYDWGSLAVWAWGALRVADYLLNESWVDANSIPNVDPNVLIITGHSRRGKTALLAGAFDERFTMVVPNGSGCGGAGSFLVQGVFAETIASIGSPNRFKSWFQKDFGKSYGGKEQNLPFDQHFLRGLVAPRIILSTDATGDIWSNPIGTQAIYEATIPIYEFLNATVKNAIHYRSGGHAFTAQDFEVLLNLSDKLLLGKNISGNFYMTPYDMDFPIEYTVPD